MELLKKIFNSLFAEEEVKPRPKIPRNVKLVDNGKLRPKTKYIIESQASKELDYFNELVDSWREWLAKQSHWGMNSMFETYSVIPKLSKKGLLALRAANSKYNTWFPASYYIDQTIEDTLKARGYKFVFKKGKH